MQMYSIVDQTSSDSLVEDQKLFKKRRASQRVVAISGLICAVFVVGIGFSFFYFGTGSTTGYSPAAPAKSPYQERLEQQTEAQKLFLTVPDEAKAEEWLTYYTSTPHRASTDFDKQQAIWTRDKLLGFGIPNVQLETYYPLLNAPVSVGVRIVEPADKIFACSLRELPVNGDETSGKYRDAVPAFHGYSASGNVTGKLIYVNYGLQEDFALLKSRGVDFTGSIALVKYGKNFRGLKVRAAELAGCAGVLIYSDPKDDGFVKGKTYPEGPWRPETSLQRGSVHYMALYPGDPLTPGIAATLSANRLDAEDAVSLPKIPSLPLSYADAKPLLKALNGTGFLASNLSSTWIGGLDLEYWTGPGLVQVNLENIQNYTITPIWNVIAKIEGFEEPQKSVVLGNHRDAWVFGGVDPSSGSSALLEVARGLGANLAKGWKPRRSIILASWDAEEYGMIGSTEHVEDHLKEITSSVVAYLNVDTGASGPYLDVSATPSLSQLIREQTKRVNDPKTNLTLYDAWCANQNSTKSVDLEEGSDELQISSALRAFPRVGTLGSGSDFVAYVDFAGTAAMGLAFKGDYGVYHSNYDSLNWMKNFGDPGFHYQVTAAKLWGLIGMELAGPVLLPLNYTEYAVELEHYVKVLETKTGNVTFPLLHEAIANLSVVASKFDAEKATILDGLRSNASSVENDVNNWNERAQMAERSFLDPKGIPSRPWFKHIVYAPGLWAGYGAATFPTLSELFAQPEVDMVLVAFVEAELACRISRVSAILEDIPLKEC